MSLGREKAPRIESSPVCYKLKDSQYIVSKSKQETIAQPRLLDLYNREARYRKWLEKIENDTTVFSTKDKEDIRKFIAQMENDGLSLLRRIKYFSFLYQIRKHLNKSFRDVTMEDIENLLKEMLDGGIYKTADSIQSFRALLKRFYKFLLGNNEEFPEQVRFVTRMKIRKEIRDESEDIQEKYLTEEEIQKVIENSGSLSSKAILAIGYESGGRPEEILRMRIKSVVFDEKGCILFLGLGKTFQRRIRIVAYASLLNQYIENHPFKNDPGSPLWLTTSTNHRNKPMGIPGFEKIVKTGFERCGIQKPARPYILRHSRATHLAKFLTESQLCAYFGWVQGSKVVRKYVHLSGRDVDSAVLRAAGFIGENGEMVSEASKSPVTQLRRCLRCKELISPVSSFCSKCGLSTNLTEIYLGEKRYQMEVEDKLNKLTVLVLELIQSLAPQRYEEFKEILLPANSPAIGPPSSSPVHL
jgi:integrase/recombinase XerD